MKLRFSGQERLPCLDLLYVNASVVRTRAIPHLPWKLWYHRNLEWVWTDHAVAINSSTLRWTVPKGSDARSVTLCLITFRVCCGICLNHGDIKTVFAAMIACLDAAYTSISVLSMYSLISKHHQASRASDVECWKTFLLWFCVALTEALGR